MKIKSLEYFNKALELKLEHIEFKNLTLLVGASGVGKTQILKAILDLKKIATGSSLNGVEWRVEFSLLDNSHYLWEGAFENKGFAETYLFDENSKEKPKIIYENLYHNGQKIVDRNQQEIIFNGAKTVKLSQIQSVLNLLKEEDIIYPAHQGLIKTQLNDYSRTSNTLYELGFFDAKGLHNKFQSLKEIQNSDKDTRVKLYLASVKATDIFNTIKQQFIEVFPQVEDIKVAPLDLDKEDIPIFIKESPVIQIKEEAVDTWIHEGRISSGMFRTLMHISELYLCAEETVILIDEFENSLGINCIDEITDNLLNYHRNLQFIITSHHPYIINNINYNNWKLVTRKGGIVSAQDINKYNLGKSKHEAFIQLINLEEYTTGVTK